MVILKYIQVCYRVYLRWDKLYSYKVKGCIYTLPYRGLGGEFTMGNFFSSHQLCQKIVTSSNVFFFFVKPTIQNPTTIQFYNYVRKADNHHVWDAGTKSFLPSLLKKWLKWFIHYQNSSSSMV